MQLSLQTLFVATTLLAIFFGMIQSLGIVSTIIVAAFIVWESIVVFLLRFASTTWFLLAVTAILLGISVTYTHITAAMFFMLAVVVLWPIAQFLILALRHSAKRRAIHWQIYAFVTFLFISASNVLTQWPLRLSFTISRPALEKLAQQVQAGHRINRPRRAGLFMIRASRRTSDGVVCLWTLPDPNGKSGFVQCGPNRAKRFNLWSTLQLSDDWQLISED